MPGSYGSMEVPCCCVPAQNTHKSTGATQKIAFSHELARGAGLGELSVLVYFFTQAKGGGRGSTVDVPCLCSMRICVSVSASQLLAHTKTVSVNLRPHTKTVSVNLRL